MFEYGGVIISDAAFIFPENEFLKYSLEDDFVCEKWGSRPVDIHSNNVYKLRIERSFMQHEYNSMKKNDNK